MECRELLARYADVCRSSLAAFPSEAVAEKIRLTVEKQGRFVINATPGGEYVAQHCAEELQVRFKSGKPFGRADRAALPVEPLYQLPQPLRRARLATLAPHDLVLMWAPERSPGPEDLVSPAGTIVVGSNASTTISLPFLGGEVLIKGALSRAVLHAICEMLEPEWQGEERLRSDLEASAGAALACREDVRFIDQVERLRTQYQSASILCLVGNGGSACDAMELAARGQERGRIAYHFLEGGFLTCAYNDGFSPFARAVESFVDEGALWILISTSGNSSNLLDAYRELANRKRSVIPLLGNGGGELGRRCSESLVVPLETGARIQEIQLLVGGTFCHGR